MPNIVLRSAKNRSRFFARSRWVNTEKRARRFPSAQAAVMFCHEHDIQDAEVMVRFDELDAPPVVVTIPRELPGIAGPGEEWMSDEDTLIAAV